MVGGCACVFAVGSIDIAGKLRESVSTATAVLYGSWVSCCSLGALGHGSHGLYGSNMVLVGSWSRG